MPAAAGALLLAGCGGGGKAAGGGGTGASDAAKAAVTSAAEKTAGTTANVEVKVLLRKPGASRALAYKATGVVTPDAGRLRIDRSSIGDEVVDEIFTRSDGRLVIYTTSPNTKAGLPKGKDWLKVDMTKLGQKRYGADTTFLAGSDQDPFQALALLRSSVATVKNLGQDWLPDRTLNTRYRGTVNVVAAAKAAGVTGKGLAALVKDIGRPTQTIDVWVSDKGYVARTVVEGPEKTQIGTLTLQETTDFTKFGLKASVSAPPAAKTADYFTLSDEVAAKPTDSAPSGPRSTCQRWPGSTGNGGTTAPAITTSPSCGSRPAAAQTASRIRSCSPVSAVRSPVAATSSPSRVTRAAAPASVCARGGPSRTCRW